MASRNQRQLMRRLQEIGERMTEAAKEVLRESAQEVAEDAKSRCPVKTGKLRDSISVEESRGGTVYKITANAKNDDGVCYGFIVEYSPSGTPFLLPALEANKNRIRTKLREALRQHG